MMSQVMVAASTGSPAIGSIIGFAILMLLVVGILARLMVVFARRGKNGVKKEVAAPVVDSGGVQSELYGYRPIERKDSEPGERPRD